MVENVAAFAKSRQFLDFERATAVDGSLADYTFEHRVLNAADYGSPQARRRAVLIGRRRDQPSTGLPEPTHSASQRQDVRLAFNGIPHEVQSTELPRDRIYRFRGRDLPGYFTREEMHLGRRYEDLSLSRFAAIPPGGSRFDLPDELQAPCWRTHKTGSGDVMGRMHWDRPSVTVRTEFFKPEKGRYLHPVAHRAITHYEAAVLQGFPNTHRFVGSKTSIARQIGNAVPIPLGAAVGRQLLSLF